MTAETRRKLADLLPRIASDYEGEVANTARAIVRVLRAEGLDLHDVAALILSAPVPEGRPDDSVPDWQIMVETAMRLQLWRTDWEKDFLHGLRDWNGDEITEKQARVLQRIFDRGG